MNGNPYSVAGINRKITQSIAATIDTLITFLFFYETAINIFTSAFLLIINIVLGTK